MKEPLRNSTTIKQFIYGYRIPMLVDKLSLVMILPKYIPYALHFPLSFSFPVLVSPLPSCWAMQLNVREIRRISGQQLNRQVYGHIASPLLSPSPLLLPYLFPVDLPLVRKGMDITRSPNASVAQLHAFTFHKINSHQAA